MEETIRKEPELAQLRYPLCILLSCTVRMALVKSADLLEPELLSVYTGRAGLHSWAAFPWVRGWRLLSSHGAQASHWSFSCSAQAHKCLGPQWLQPIGATVQCADSTTGSIAVQHPQKLIHSMLDLPRSEELVALSPALTGGVFTIKQQGSPCPSLLHDILISQFFNVAWCLEETQCSNRWDHTGWGTQEVILGLSA